ncbi:MAG TPA: amidohydrolase family protein, partial [Jatrophihabitans sp.]|nr:amidohydrolase family protein [Jatrophihabitans sp.]
MALHVRGVFLPDETERDAWIVGGRLTFTRPSGGSDTIADRGWITPGFVDAHCHVGLAPSGHVPDPDEQAEQALLDRAAGALLLRDAGSPVDNRGVQQRDDLPRLIRAGRHIARPKRYIRGLGIEVEPDDLVAEVERQAAAGDGWVKIAADWIDRSLGDLAPVWPDDALKAAVARAHELGARVAAHVFGEDALPGLIAAGIDSIEHGTGLTDELISAAKAADAAVVPTLINIDNFPQIALAGQEKFPT